MTMNESVKKQRDELANEYASKLPSGGYSNIYGCYQSAYNAAWDIAEKRYQKVVDSADALKREIQGLMSAHRVVLGYDYGNSNCEAVDYRIKNLDAALKDLDQ